MNSPLFRYFGTAVFWLLSAPAGAYQGVELGRDCRSGDDAARARCEGFINGFIAGAQVDIEGEPINMWRSYGYTWCGPTVAEVATIIEALFEAARTGRSTPHFPAAVVLAQSLTAKYPCEGSSVPRYQGLNPSLGPDD